MNSDPELLRRYASGASEEAFGELVARHVDLVYSAALRSASGDPHRAEDITQQVFALLARNSASLANHPALAGWLYTTTRRVALHALRVEQRRAAREQEAHAMMEGLREEQPECDWNQLRPVIDRALEALPEKDRVAILLRFFQAKTFPQIGAILGLRENTARMRVDRALEKLRRELARRGFSSSGAALAACLALNAVNAAPAGFVSSLGAIALAQAAKATPFTLSFLNLMTFTKPQLAIVSAIAVASLVAPLLILRHGTRQLNIEEQTFQQREQQRGGLQAENQRLTQALAAVTDPAGTPNRELLRLRGEVTRLRKDILELGQPKSPSRADQIASLADRYSRRIAELKQYVAANRSESIPELRFMTEKDWMWLAGEKTPDTHEGYQRAMSLARLTVEGTVAREILRPALLQFAADHDGAFPAEIRDLARYLKTPLEESILQRWQVVQASKLANLRGNLEKENWVITQRAPVNRSLDQRIVFSAESFHMFADAAPEHWDVLP